MSNPVQVRARENEQVHYASGPRGMSSSPKVKPLSYPCSSGKINVQTVKEIDLAARLRRRFQTPEARNSFDCSAFRFGELDIDFHAEEEVDCDCEASSMMKRQESALCIRRNASNSSIESESSLLRTDLPLLAIQTPHTAHWARHGSMGPVLEEHESDVDLTDDDEDNNSLPPQLRSESHLCFGALKAEEVWGRQIPACFVNPFDDYPDCRGAFRMTNVFQMDV